MYNNPFLYQTVKPSIFSRLFKPVLSKGINWGGLLTNTQKSLGIINQAIPLVYQIKPIISNAKTMFKIAGAMKEDTSKEEQTNNNDKITNVSNSNKPIFYI